MNILIYLKVANVKEWVFWWFLMIFPDLNNYSIFTKFHHLIWLSVSLHTIKIRTISRQTKALILVNISWKPRFFIFCADVINDSIFTKIWALNSTTLISWPTKNQIDISKILGSRFLWNISWQPRRLLHVVGIFNNLRQSLKL